MFATLPYLCIEKQKKDTDNMTNNTLTQELPTEVQNIISQFLNKTRKNNIFNNSLEQLAVSLYAARKGAGASKVVMDILGDRLVALSDYFTEHEQSLLQDNYAAVVEFCLDAYNKDILDSHSGMSAQPEELTAFLTRLMEPALTEGSEVYLPFAGLCSEPLAMKGCHIEGEELSPKAWALAQIRLDAHGIEADIRLADSFLSLMQKDGKRYDTIMFTPPFGLRCGENHRLTEMDAVRLAFDNKLKKGGRICCVLPASFTFNGSRVMDLRRYFVERGYLRAVISLPRVFAPFTQIDTVVLVVEKSEREGFLVVDGSSFSARNRINNSCILESAALYEAMENEKERICTGLTKNDLDENLLLSPARYLLKLPELSEGEKAYMLQDLVENVGLRRGHYRDGISQEPTLVISTLSDNYINCDVRNLSANDERQSSRRNLFLYEVDAPCVVVQPLYGRIKVGELSGKGKLMVGTRQEVFFLRKKNDIVLDKYLLRTLTSDFVRCQVVAKSYGTMMTRMREEDLMQTVIPVPFKDNVPDLDRQKQILLDDLNLSVSEGEKRLAHELEEYKKDVHIKKHAIGQILFGLNVNMKLLRKIRSMTKGVLDESKTIGEGENALTIGDVLENIDRQIKAVNNAVLNFTAGEDAVYQEEDIALAPFFEDFCERHKNDVYDIWYQPSDDDYAKADVYELLEDENGLPCGVSGTNPVIRKGDPLKYVKFSKQALEEILENICANAMEYGFKGREDGNQVCISIEDVDGCYVVSVANNGHAINAGMNVADVFKYGVTTSERRDKHSGIGGYQIKKLMERFGGTAVFVRQPDNDFPVSYRLTFKNTNVSASFSLQ